ncbi:MAG TPA: response regulator [Dehalococcoidia bacterium]|nr:response regulator [Dehalococcoidia bacterium]
MDRTERSEPPASADTHALFLDDEELRVLLVEDNAADARLIREALREAPIGIRFAVEEAPRLADALARLSAAPFHAALLDLGLPDAAGLEGVLRLRAAAPELPIIVLTGRIDDDLAQRALLRGAQDYLVKGAVEDTELQRAVRYAIERQRAERALRGTLDELRGQCSLYEAALALLPRGVLIAAADGAITLVNPAARRLLDVDALSAQTGDQEAGFWQNLAEPGPADRLPLARALVSEEPAAGVYALAGEAGRRVAVWAQRLLAADGAVLGAVALLDEASSGEA